MEITTHLIKNDWLPETVPHGYWNGYIGIPPERPWFGKHYDDIDVSVHGGLTYADDHLPREKSDGKWYLGFDTCHSRNNKLNCDEAYCKTELESLKQQAIEATKK